MKIAGFIKSFNEGGNGNLDRCLSQLKRFCDVIAVCDDTSTDNSLDIIKKYTDLYMVLPDEFKNETEHKQKLLEFALQNHPDITHFFWLDSDEIIEARGAEGGIRKLCGFMDEFSIDGISFHETNLWRSQVWYRTDNRFNELWKVNLWRNNGNLKFDTSEGLHKPQHPTGMLNIVPSNLQILHYGFSTTELIARKYKTYKAFGQTGWALNRLINEEGLQLQPANMAWFPKEIMPRIGAPPRIMGEEEWKKSVS